MVLTDNDSVLIAFGVGVCIVTLLAGLIKLVWGDEMDLHRTFYDEEDIDDNSAVEASATGAAIDHDRVVQSPQGKNEMGLGGLGDGAATSMVPLSPADAAVGSFPPVNPMTLVVKPRDPARTSDHDHWSHDADSPRSHQQHQLHQQHHAAAPAPPLPASNRTSSSTYLSVDDDFL